jgi:hypothetical protein
MTCLTKRARCTPSGTLRQAIYLQAAAGPADTDRRSPRRLEEEPGAMLRLVDPVLYQARGSDIAILIAKGVCVS